MNYGSHPCNKNFGQQCGWYIFFKICCCNSQIHWVLLERGQNTLGKQETSSSTHCWVNGGIDENTCLPLNHRHASAYYYPSSFFNMSLFTFLSVYLFMYVCIHVSIYVSISWSVYLFINPFPKNLNNVLTQSSNMDVNISCWLT